MLLAGDRRWGSDLELAAGLTYVCQSCKVRAMRTTVRLNDRLAARVRAYTKRTNQTFTDVVQEALEEMLRKRTAATSTRIELPVVYGRTKLSNEQLQKAIEEQQQEDDLKSLGLRR